MINRKQIFAVAWRVALFTLPLQTRWILTPNAIGSSFWEQGTVAIYGSWVLMIVAIILGALPLLQSSRVKRSGTEGPFVNETQLSQTVPPLVPSGLGWDDLERVLPFIGVGLLIIGSLFTSSPIATALWWIHVFILAAFAWTLWKNQVGWVEFATWFVIALMPQAVLGIWQFLQQKVDGSTLLGIASQRGWMRGVSVIEYGEYRILRAYAGFPHPNVFGGWLAIGATLLPTLIAVAKTDRARYAWIACGSVLVMALVFSFSRGAWIAAAAGAVIAFVLSWKQVTTKPQRESLRVAALVFSAIALLCICSQWEAVATRFQATAKLEQWSVEQRVTSITDGFFAFTHRPVFGWGPGAALVGIDDLHHAPSPTVSGFDAAGAMIQFHAPIEPPHVAPLAALVETGIIGFLAIILLIGLLVRHLWQSKQLIPALPILASAAILSATDHYLWTLWAGQALLFIVVISTFLNKKNPPDKS